MCTNKKMKSKLKKEYGKGCFFERAEIEKQIEEINKTRKKKIKTYKKYKEEKKYTNYEIKKIEKIMSCHHLKHKSEGGKTNIDNCVNINRLAHDYIHDLPRKEEEVVNNMLRKYKQEFKLLSCELKGGKIENRKEIKFNYDFEDCITIPLIENEKEIERDGR